MAEKKQFELFPKHMGFFPYIWLVYLLYPFYNLIGQSGWKLILGGGMLVIIVVAYRQLYFVTNNFVMWACIQLIIIFLLSMYYDPYLIFLGFYTANAMGFAPTKKQ